MLTTAGALDDCNVGRHSEELGVCQGWTSGSRLPQGEAYIQGRGKRLLTANASQASGHLAMPRRHEGRACIAR